MTGSFSVTLLEILAYLIPGGLTCAAILNAFFPKIVDRTISGLGEQISFLACSYVMGHLVTFLSVVLRKISTSIRRHLHKKTREERMPFYPELLNKLHSLLGPSITKDDEYEFSLRIVIEHQPHSGQTIDRLYAMTLFSRNTSLSLLAAGILLILKDVTAAAAILVLAVIFFLRYMQLEGTTSNTVFRAAYVYLCSEKKQEGESSKASNAL